MKNQFKFSLVIPNLNGMRLLLPCLESIRQAINYSKLDNQVELILVDNASIDNSCELFINFCNKNKITHQLLNLKRNYGFAGAVNRGIKASKGKWAILCNNDLKFEKNWFSSITNTIKASKDPKLAAVTGTVLSYDGAKIESQGLKYFYSGKCENLSFGKILDKKLLERIKNEPAKEIWGASATLTAYNKDILEKVEMLDEIFFAYEEDVDLSLRLHNLRYKTLYVPSAICYHLGGATSKKMGNFIHKMNAKNWIYIIIKNYSKRELFNNFFAIIEQRLRNFSGLIKNTPSRETAHVIIETYGEVFKNFQVMINKRGKIKSLRLSSYLGNQKSY